MIASPSPPASTTCPSKPSPAAPPPGVAGLVNALPAESVELFHRAGEWESAWELYYWFLPLLRLDCVPEFVQLIKLVQAEVGMGSETVRMPRMVLPAAQREATLKLVRDAMASRPDFA